MKNVKKVTRLRLESDQTDEFIISGLVSSEPDYKLSLLLNKKLRISLKSLPPVNIPGSPGVELQFSRFSAAENSGLTYTLFSNRAGKDFLLKKLKNVDYILMIHDPEHEINPTTLASSIREMESVTALFNIDTDSLKDKNFQYLIH
jgi:hypothetical protein